MLQALTGKCYSPLTLFEIINLLGKIFSLWKTKVFYTNRDGQRYLDTDTCRRMYLRYRYMQKNVS